MRYPLREMFNALRWLARAGAPWRLLSNDFPPWTAVYQQRRRWNEAGSFEAMVGDMRSIIRVSQGRKGQPSAAVIDGRTLQSTCESGPRAGHDGYKRKMGSKVHMAVDTMGNLLALTVTPADEQERSQVKALCEAVQRRHGRDGQAGVGGSGLHGRSGQGRCQGDGDRVAGGEAARGEEGVRAAAQALGGGAQFRLDGEVQKAEPGLRAAAAGAGGAAFRGRRDAHGAQG